MAHWLTVAGRRDVVMRALKTAVVVGAVLILINQGDAIVRGDLSGGGIFKMLLTALVPYCVSTYSSVGAILALERGAAHGAGR